MSNKNWLKVKTPLIGEAEAEGLFGLLALVIVIVILVVAFIALH